MDTNYTCHYCENEAQQPHSIPLYQKDGIEDGFEVLCDTCYADWLLSLKG